MNNENIHYLINTKNKHKLFIYSYISNVFKEKIFLFLNPIFDEKKKVQSFQTTTARELTKCGYHVLMFDYFATGDSGGNSFELELYKNLDDIEFIIEYLREQFHVSNITLLGVRLGADIGMHYAANSDLIKNLVLIEPIIVGKRYLTEQRTRKSAFYRINNIKPPDNPILINGMPFEDFLGYPLSQSNINYLNELNANSLDLTNKKITLIKLDCFYSKRIIHQLEEKLRIDNILEFKEIECSDFWTELEMVDTNSITNYIINSYN